MVFFWLQLGSVGRNVAAHESLQEYARQTPLLARLYGTEASARKQDSDDNGKGYVNHAFLLFDKI